MSDLVFGFCLYGLRDPYTTSGVDAQKPILFTDRGIDVAQLPAEFANYKVLAILPPGQDPGENWVGDPRGGLGAGGEQSIDIPEDGSGALARILLPDPKAPYWLVRTPVIEEDTVGNIDIYVNGGAGAANAPAIGSIYWIESEAFYAGNVVDVSLSTGLPMSYRVVASRAHCGSFQERHEIDPASYGENGGGNDVRLRFDSKPNFQGNRFKGAFFLWRLPTRRETVATEVERRYFFVDKPPVLVEREGKFFYSIQPRPVADLIDGYKFSATPKALALTERVQVVQLEEESSAAGYSCRPKKAKLILSRLKTELLFRHVVHLPPSGVLNPALLSDLWNRIQAARPLVDHRIVVRSLGVWVFKIASMSYATIRGIKKATFDLDLVGYEPGSTLTTSHPSGGPVPPGTGLGFNVGSVAGFGHSDPIPPFEKGWAWYPQTSVVEGEEAPTVELRWSFQCTPIEAALICLLSRGAATAGAYDKLIGRPLALPTSWINTGATAADPLTIDPRTKELLQLNQLLDETIVPQFQGEDTVGGFLRDLNLFYLLIFTPLSTGKFTFRRWATSQPVGLSEINPTKRSLDVGDLLEPLQALRLLSGINEGDLSPQYGRSVTLGGIKTVEALANAVPLRIWQPGNVLSDEALQGEAFSVFFRALFSVLGGAPRLFAVETSLEAQTFDPGDVVQWTDKRIPTPEGIGFTNVRFLVVGKDVNFQEETATYRLLRDYFNETTTTESRVAPCLRIEQVLSRAGFYKLEVVSIGDPVNFQVDSSYDEIYNELQAEGSKLRLFFPLEHNPDPTNEEERPGYLEAYGEIVQIDLLDGGKRSVIHLDIDANWERGGFTLYDIVRRGARIYFTDRREEDQNPQGILIEPNYLQLYADGLGFDYAKWGNEQTFDANYTLISDVP